MEASDIKQRVTMEEVLERYGIARESNRYLCPFHNDTKPSMTVKNERYRCWTCGAHGDAIAFVSERFGLSYGDALKELNATFNLGLTNEKPSKKKQREMHRMEAEKEDINRSISKTRDELTTYHRALYKFGHYDQAREVFNKLNELEGESIGY